MGIFKRKKITTAAVFTLAAMLTFTSVAFAEETPTDKITVMLTGDLMCQRSQQLKAFDGTSYDFKPTFRYVKKIFDEADIVIGNLETLVSESLPLSKDMNLLQGKPYLNAPNEWLDALEYAGFDGLIMANNHACDGGKTGIIETLEELDRRGIPHTGLYRSKQEKRYFTMERNGIKIGILSYAAYYNLKDKFLTGEEQDTMLSRPIQNKMNADVQALRKEGAEYIIAYSHSGTEYSHVPAARQERYGAMLVQAGVDYIVGSHPHVLQPYEPLRYQDTVTPYIYSMGNFISNQRIETMDGVDSAEWTERGVLMDVTLEKKNGQTTIKTAQAHPTWVNRTPKGTTSPEGYPLYTYQTYILEDFIKGGKYRNKLDEETKERIDTAYKEMNAHVNLKWK